MKYARHASLLFTLPIFLLAGCGDLITAEGQIYSNGQPFAAPKGKALQVTLHPVEITEGYPVEDVFGAVRQDGSFYFVGRRGKGIPRGRYDVSVKLTTRFGESDIWKGRYGKEKLNQEVAVDGSDIEIELPDTSEP